jgi:hypothetical protein
MDKNSGKLDDLMRILRKPGPEPLLYASCLKVHHYQVVESSINI